MVVVDLTIKESKRAILDTNALKLYSNTSKSGHFNCGYTVVTHKSNEGKRGRAEPEIRKPVRAIAVGTVLL